MEELKGYVVDLACLRKYPREEIVERSRQHSVECALMGHCIESGYGLVDSDGTLSLIDDHGTLKIADLLRSSGLISEIYLRLLREVHEGEMRTVKVELSRAPH